MQWFYWITFATIILMPLVVFSITCLEIGKRKILR